MRLQTWPALPVRPTTEVMLIMRPVRFFIMIFVAACAQGSSALSRIGTRCTCGRWHASPTRCIPRARNHPQNPFH